jgi:hypothetical protein
MRTPPSNARNVCKVASGTGDFDCRQHVVADERHRRQSDLRATIRAQWHDRAVLSRSTSMKRRKRMGLPRARDVRAAMTSAAILHAGIEPPAGFSTREESPVSASTREQSPARASAREESPVGASTVTLLMERLANAPHRGAAPAQPQRAATGAPAFRPKVLRTRADRT